MRELAQHDDACAGGARHTSAALSRTVQGFADIEQAIFSVDLALHKISTTGHVCIATTRKAALAPRPPPSPLFEPIQ